MLGRIGLICILQSNLKIDIMKVKISFKELRFGYKDSDEHIYESALNKLEFKKLEVTLPYIPTVGMTMWISDFRKEFNLTLEESVMIDDTSETMIVTEVQIIPNGVHVWLTCESVYEMGQR